MIPEWVTKILQGMGVEGAIIWALAMSLIASATANAAQWRHSVKVYKYRLAERDTLNKALTDAASVLSDMLKVTEERNELSEEQAELIDKQSQAFELLRVTVSMQFDTLKGNHFSQMDHMKAVAQAVGAMAASIQQLHQLVLENRISVAEHVNGVKRAVDEARGAILSDMQSRNTSLIAEMRQLIGVEATVIRRRTQQNGSKPKRPA